MSNNEAREKFLAVVRGVAEEFVHVQPVSIPAENMKRSMDRVLAAYRSMAVANPKLYECTPASVARAIALSAMTGLMPGKGTLAQVDLIPRKKKGTMELDWQIGWRGYVTLAERSGVRIRPPVIVYKGDVFDYSEVPPDLRHKPDPLGRQWGKWEEMVGVYLTIDRPVTGFDFVYLPMTAVADRRERSEAWQQWLSYQEQVKAGKAPRWPDGNLKDEPDCPWVQWPVEMVQKTILRWAAQRMWLPMDDVSAYAAQQDSVADLPEPKMLPDYDPVGMNAAPSPAPERVKVPRGMDAVDQALGGKTYEAATQSPPDTDERTLLKNTFRDLERELGYQPAIDLDSLTDEGLKAGISKMSGELDLKTQGQP